METILENNIENKESIDVKYNIVVDGKPLIFMAGQMISQWCCDVKNYEGVLFFLVCLINCLTAFRISLDEGQDPSGW